MADVPDDAYDLRDCRVVVATQNALLLASPSLPENADGLREKWVPRSNVHEDSEVYERGHSGTCLIKLWWAEQEGLV